MNLNVTQTSETHTKIRNGVLLSDTPGVRASLFMPMHMAGRETRQNPIQFKNALRDLRSKLERGGLEQPRDLVGTLSTLIDDHDFWQNQARGLAIFVDPGETHLFKTNIELDECVYVAEQFMLLPLLGLLSRDVQHSVLAISPNRVRWFHVERFSAEELPLPGDMPGSLYDVVGGERSEQHLQFHTTGTNAPAPVYHGHGAGKDDEKPELDRFCRAIADALPLGDEGQPRAIIAAGDQQLVSMLENTTNTTIVHRLEGNFDNVESETLREALVPFMQKQRNAHIGTLTERFGAALAQERASLVPDSIRLAAAEGRVETLLVALENAGDNQPLPPPNDEFCNEVLLATLRHGGNAIDVDLSKMPGGRRLAALLRY